jgi:hypothetical protein
LPHASQPPFDASKDTTPGDFNNPLPSKKVSKVLLPDEAPAVPDPEPTPVPVAAPPPAPEPVPLRRSAQLRKIPTRPGTSMVKADTLLKLKEMLCRGAHGLK